MIPIQPYLNTRTAFGPTFAGNDRLVFLTDITGQQQAWGVDLSHPEPAWPDQLTFGSERVMHVSAIPGDQRLLLSRDVGGNENTQFFLLDPVTGQESALTAGFEAAMHLPEIWRQDGRQFYFAANRRHPGVFDLYRQAPDGQPAAMLWENDRPGYLLSLALSPDGRRLAFNRIFSSFHNELWELDLSSRAARRLDDPGHTAIYTNLVYAPDGHSLLCCTDAGADFLYVGQLDLASGALAPLIQPEGDVEALALAPDGQTLIYAVNEGGASHLYRLDWATRASTPAPWINDVVGLLYPFSDQSLAFSPDSQAVAFAFMRPTRPSDIYVWDLADNTVRAVTRSSTGGLPVARFVEPDLVHYPTFDGRQIPAWYFRPAAGNEPLPAVVYVHGGPESQFRPMFHFLVQYLVAAGYAVLAPNVRGSTGYGKTYAHLDDVEKRLDSVADLGHAALWLGAQPEIDSARLAVYGGSYGGFMVLAALTRQANLWAAGVDIVGISNFVTFLENTSDYRRAHREAEYGSLARDRDLLERISPINDLAAIDAPLFVIHGANDPRVPLSEAEQIVAALRDRAHPVELLVFSDEGHGIARLANKEIMYPQVIAFLNQHVKDRAA